MTTAGGAFSKRRCSWTGRRSALLRHSLAHYDELSALPDETLIAYRARDLAASWGIQQAFAAR